MSEERKTRALAWLAVLGVLAALPTGSAAAAPAGELERVAEERLSDRLVELTLRTSVLRTDTTGVRVLLPAGYDADPRRRYPVLYLLHGAVDDFRSWTDKGSAEALTADLPLIVVMPDAGWDGWYSDHYNFGRFGPPKWETYHVGQLIDWIDEHYRTVRGRRGRATAGLSMGGFGAMSYAARHPDRFVAAASFSGAVNTNLPQPTGQPDAPLDGSVPYAFWGPYQTEQVRWRGHNPWDLAENLAGLALTIRTGNGYDADGNFVDPVEYQVHADSLSFAERLTELEIPHVFEDYGAGDHSWPYWQTGLAKTLPWLMAVFADPPRRPARVTFSAIEPRYAVFGWRVALARDALEFSRLAHGDRHGFTLSGSGSATVTTPARYTPRGRYRVTIDGPVPAVRALRAGRAGRLRILVDLGAANAVQQYTPAERATPTVVRSARVEIRRP